MNNSSKLYYLLSRKLSGEASPEEIEQLKAMLAEGAENDFIAQSLESFWQQPYSSAESATEEKLDHLLNTLKNETGEKASIGFWKKFKWHISIAATIIPIVIFGYNLVSQKPIKEQTRVPALASKIITPAGSRKQLTLPDGTNVWLNAASSLIIHKNFNEETREVELKGEAYFDVAHNAQKPFIVHTSVIDIKVLGTKFDVKDYETEPNIETTLLHGAIEVVKRNEPGSARVILNPNEKLVFAKKNLLTHNGKEKKVLAEYNKIKRSDITITTLKADKKIVDIPETAWMYNKLVFEEENFETIGFLMERWYNVTIHFADAEIKNYRMSGTFVNETVNEALDILKILVPFDYDMNGNNILIGKLKNSNKYKRINNIKSK